MSTELEKLALKRKLFTLELQKVDIEEQIIGLKTELKTEKPVPHVVTTNIQPVKPIEKVTLSASGPDRVVEGEKIRKKILLQNKKLLIGSMEIDPSLVQAGDKIKIFDKADNSYVMLRGSNELEAIGETFTVYGRQYLFVRSINKEDGDG